MGFANELREEPTKKRGGLIKRPPPIVNMV
jgi:hypothetical protein